MDPPTHDRPFLPNVIKFYPFPELVPAAEPILLDHARPWQATAAIDLLQSRPATPPEAALLYIHIPYCDFFCHFCPIYKTTKRVDYAYPQQQRYVNALRRELACYARRIATNRILNGIYFGGGTPTSLPLPLLDQIVESVRKEFELAPTVEMTIEGIPTHFVDSERLKFLCERGFNRISFGVQSLDEDIRRGLGRGDSVSDCYAAVEAAHNAGISHVNVDIMYGYPGQTVSRFLRDVDAVRQLGADSIDFYYYTPVPGTPYRDRILSGRIGNPNDVVPLANMRRALLSHMSDWCQVTSECFNRESNEVACIWSHALGGQDGVSEVISVGVSAYGQIAGHYYYNHATLRDYLSDIERGCLPLRSRIELGSKALATRLLLRSVLLGGIPKRLSVALPRSLRGQIRRWVSCGLLAEGADCYRLSPEGQVRFQMLMCECVPKSFAFVMMRRYMMTFQEQEKLLFQGTDLLYAHSVTQMIMGHVPVVRMLRKLGYRALLLFPVRFLDFLVEWVIGVIRWRSRFGCFPAS